MPTDPVVVGRGVRPTAEQARVLVACQDDFRVFLDYWHIRDEAGEDLVLGACLWEAQEGLVEAMKRSPFVANLKARRLGASTLAVAWDAHVVRFGPPNARVHLFSRTEEDAREMLHGRTGEEANAGLVYGLRNLPEWMQLPTRTRARDVVLDAGRDDKRMAVAYASDADVSAGTRCTHAHIDELARMENAERLWQAVQPTIVQSAHLLSTGLGPDNWWGRFWTRARNGGTRFDCYFAPASARTGRDLEERRRELSDRQFRNEYAESEADALHGGGEYAFDPMLLERAGTGIGPEAAEADHVYRVGWDIGSRQDAAVGIVVDITPSPAQIVRFTYLAPQRGGGTVPYPVIQEHIRRDWLDYCKGSRESAMYVEANGPGNAALDNVELPEAVVERARTHMSKPLKARMLNNLVSMFEHDALAYSRDACPELDRELRGYQWQDSGIPQDTVMALGIALHDAVAIGRSSRGRWRHALFESLNAELGRPSTPVRRDPNKMLPSSDTGYQPSRTASPRGRTRQPHPDHAADIPA